MKEEEADENSAVSEKEVDAPEQDDDADVKEEETEEQEEQSAMTKKEDVGLSSSQSTRASQPSSQSSALESWCSVKEDEPDENSTVAEKEVDAPEQNHDADVKEEETEEQEEQSAMTKKEDVGLSSSQSTRASQPSSQSSALESWCSVKEDEPDENSTVAEKEVDAPEKDDDADVKEEETDEQDEQSAMTKKEDVGLKSSQSTGGSQPSSQSFALELRAGDKEEASVKKEVAGDRQGAAVHERINKKDLRAATIIEFIRSGYFGKMAGRMEQKIGINNEVWERDLERAALARFLQHYHKTGDEKSYCRFEHHYQQSAHGILTRATLNIEVVRDRRFYGYAHGMSDSSKDHAERAACRAFKLDTEVNQIRRLLPPTVQDIRKYFTLTRSQREELQDLGHNPTTVQWDIVTGIYNGFRDLGCRTSFWDGSGVTSPP